MNEYQIQLMLSRGKGDILGLSVLDTIYVRDIAEPLVKLVDYLDIIIAPRTGRFQEGETFWAREQVAKSLAQVAEEIFPNRIKVYDAFRSVAYQKLRYDLFREKVCLENPGWTEGQIDEETFVSVFPPSLDPQKPPAHATGGALDLTLVDSNGIDRDMGSRWADFESPFMSTNAVGLTSEQRGNRETLVTLMGKAGFMSYPGEWWHYSYGDREWAAYQGLKEAFYGRAEDPYK